jgi:hypothetical protein
MQGSCASHQSSKKIPVRVKESTKNLVIGAGYRSRDESISLRI